MNNIDIDLDTDVVPEKTFNLFAFIIGLIISPFYVFLIIGIIILLILMRNPMYHWFLPVLFPFIILLVIIISIPLSIYISYLNWFTIMLMLFFIIIVYLLIYIRFRQ